MMLTDWQVSSEFWKAAIQSDDQYIPQLSRDLKLIILFTRANIVRYIKQDKPSPRPHFLLLQPLFNTVLMYERFSS